MVMGRPTKYKPEYCERIIELGKLGYSVVEMAADLDVHRESIEQNWPQKHEDFSEAFARAKQHSQAWWEAKGRENLTADRFQTHLWTRSMSARFPKEWREKQLIGSDPENPLPSTGFDASGLSTEVLRELAAAKKSSDDIDT